MWSHVAVEEHVGHVEIAKLIRALQATVAETKELRKSPFMGQKKAKNHHVGFGKEPPRASVSSFPARPGPSRPSTSYLGETRGLFLHSPACSGPSATLAKKAKSYHFQFWKRAVSSRASGSFFQRAELRQGP